jgi:tyrosyl-tRNA synthetase
MTATAAALTALDEARAAGTHPLDYLRGRGYVQDVTDEAGLRRALDAGPVTAYVGFDPTAPSLHAGHLLGIMMLAVLQRFGHRPIALGGGGTALVGDPTGKTSTRAPVTEAAIRDNLARILPQFGRHLDFDGGRFGNNPAALLLNNADWLLPLSYIPFLRDVGRFFSVNEMLAAETYRTRLDGEGLNFVEFNYRIVQAYDFLHLYRAEGCTLQMGGSDQWGNITAGVELIRKADRGHAFALVCPLLTTAGGRKMGKTEGNSLWLDPDLTSPFDFYQYWVNVDDADVAKLLRLYTFLPDGRIAELTAAGGVALREAKRTLAFEATALTHGRAEAEKAAAAAQALFGGVGGQFGPEGDDPTIPTTEIPSSEVAAGITLADLFVRAGLAKSRGEARRLAEQGGLAIDDARVDGVDETWSPTGATALLRAGKKRYRRVRMSER